MPPNHDIHAFVHDNRAEIPALLREMVTTSSFTHDKAGIDAVGRIVTEHMPPGFEHEHVPNPNGGDHHVFTHPRGGTLPVVLAGHLDTIEVDTPGAPTLTEEGDCLLGPGVNDMKGGVTVILWALKALEASGLLKDLPVTCVFNGDEEQGSPDSCRLFTGMRGRASVGLVFECGGPAGTVVTQRKGITRWRLDIRGQACHFGNLRGPKVSAVEEMARKTLAVEALNRADGSVVANVGRAEGGLLANTVAAHASMDFECRYWRADLEDEVRTTVEDLAASVDVPGCTTELTTLSRRPPMDPSPEARRLFDLVLETAEGLGQRIVEEKRGGVSDACWLAHVGVPTIDGLGPLGDKDHSPDEYILTRSLFDRIELAARLLLALPRHGFLA